MKDRTLFSSIPIDKKHHIKSFESIGLSDPKEKGVNRPIKWLKSLHHDVRLYPDSCYTEEGKPPACVFNPTKAIMNAMIEATAKAKGDFSLIREKFCFLEMPKP